MTLLVVGLLMFTACCKEPLVEPAVQQGVTKDMTIVVPGEAPSESDGTINTKHDPDPGEGISDDGDDLSDQERNHKKKPN